MRKLKNEELGRLSAEEFLKTEKIPVILVLDNIRSLHNIGSIFRTADSFCFEAIYLCGITACPPHKDIQKTALGATETVRWKYFSGSGEAVDELKKEGYKIYAVEQAEGSISLENFKAEGSQAFIFGHEVFGVDQELILQCEGVIEVPQSGTKHSLNVAVCAGVISWEVYRQLK